MTKMILTRGAPASGKDTFALEWVNEDSQWRVRSNRDETRFQLYGEFVLDRMREETVTTFQESGVKTMLAAKHDVIISDTNLNSQTVRRWLKIAKDAGAEVEFADFDTPLEECLRRNKARGDAGGRFVPEEVIRSFFSRYYRKGKLPEIPVLGEQLELRTKYVPDESLPMAYLVDIDGTLADMSACGRGPFDWARVGEDTPIDNVIRVVEALSAQGYRIIFMSGRDAVCMNETRAWLAETPLGALGFDAPLFMRAEKDGRRDSIVKHELFYKHVVDKYHVVGVIDDRQQVVDMWREIGLTTFQCAPGDF